MSHFYQIEISRNIKISTIEETDAHTVHYIYLLIILLLVVFVVKHYRTNVWK